jgi:hypothetical protein
MIQVNADPVFSVLLLSLALPSKKSHAHMLSFGNIFIHAQVRIRLHIEYVKNSLCVRVAKHVIA